MSSPEPSPLRSQVVRVSQPLLARLQAMPRGLFMLGWLVLVAATVFAPIGVALPAAILVVVAIGWLTYLSWPLLPGNARALRVVVLIVLIALVVARFS